MNQPATGRSTEWTLTRHDDTGAAWIVRRVDQRSETHVDPTDPNTIRTTFTSTPPKYVAYTTLAHARRSIANELRLDKRVRFVKHDDNRYTYQHTYS